MTIGFYNMAPFPLSLSSLSLPLFLSLNVSILWVYVITQIIQYIFDGVSKEEFEG